MKIVLNENEKNQISSQHEEIDSRIFNFLIRRIIKTTRDINQIFRAGDPDVEIPPNMVTEYRFDGVPNFGWNSYLPKNQIEARILEMLYENDVIDFWPYYLDERDPKRVKIVKTVRKFINFILTD
jgi:hypothetical protein